MEVTARGFGFAQMVLNVCLARFQSRQLLSGPMTELLRGAMSHRSYPQA